MITFNTINIAMPAIDQVKVREWVKAVAQSYRRRVGDIAYVFVDDEEILRVKQAVEKECPNLNHAIITYHLDKDNINRYKPETYEEIYHH